MIEEVYSEIKKWFEIAIPEPTEENINVQLKCIKEEVGEYLCSTNDIDRLDGLCDIIVTCIGLAYMKGLNMDISPHSLLTLVCDDHFLGLLSDIDKELNQKSAVRLAITVNKLITASLIKGEKFEFDMIGALKEVNRSNFSKFEDGKPIFDENGKIAKGKNYTPPNLKDYV